MFFRKYFLQWIIVWALSVSVQQVVLAQDTIHSDTLVIRSISLTGNKTTKDFVILRELTFAVGDTLSHSTYDARVSESKRNLLNTSLFNFVTIINADTSEPNLHGTHEVHITIDVKERWYTWPSPVFEVMEQNMNTWWRNGHNLDRATYGFLLTRYNFMGRKETVALICRFGYSQQFGAQYSVPYLNRKRTLGVTFTGLFTQNHEVYYGTQHNQLLFYKDTEHHIRKELNASVKLQLRRGIYVRHTLDARYVDLRVHDTVVHLASDYFAGNSDRMRYFSLSYQYVCDHRDAKAYPIHGYYADIEVTRHGLGIFPDEKVNVTFFAASIRKWFSISDRIFAGAMLRARWLPGVTPPFYHQRALGFSTYIRGFEYYVIDGQSYAIGKTAIRYQLLKPRIFTFKWFPIQKFNTLHLAIYAGIFGDAGYVYDRASVATDHNSLGNSLLAGYGAGLDIVSYYDIVFRFEYTFNSLGEGGFYLHFGAPF